MSSQQLLRLKDVRFRHQDSEAYALDGISLEVTKGEFVTLLGPNSSGKSTVCMLANGLVPHAVHGTLEGTVEIFGKDVRSQTVAELSQRVGIVFQEPESQLFCMTVEEEVAFGPENLGVERREIIDRVEWALSLVGMKGLGDRSPFNLSSGQKQRVAIAAALSMRPEMLVLDEPAYALDPIGRLELYSVLSHLRKEHGVTILLAERDPEEAIAFSDRIVLMKAGRIVDSGPPRDIVRNADRLRSIGIAPTQMSEVSELLNAKAGESRFAFLDVEEAAKAISETYLSGKAGGKS
jgi:energy-coupling factor transport system ATP-binding protein